MAASWIGALADSGGASCAKGRVRGCVGGVGLCFPVLGQVGFADGLPGKKGRQSDEKNKGCFGRAKASLFGRESVAAFLVGDLGCHTGIRTAPIFDWMQQCSARETFPFRDRSLIIPIPKVCHFQLVSRHYLVESLVTRHSSLFLRLPCVCHSWAINQPLWHATHLLAPCSKIHLMPVMSMPGAGTSRQGVPTLIMGGQRRKRWTNGHCGPGKHLD